MYHFIVIGSQSDHLKHVSSAYLTRVQQTVFGPKKGRSNGPKKCWFLQITNMLMLHVKIIKNRKQLKYLKYKLNRLELYSFLAQAQ